MIRTKRAGLLTKLVVLALLIALATTLLELQGQIAAKVSELVGLGVAKDAIGVAVKNACGTANYKKVEDAALLGAVLTALNVLGGEA